MTPNSVARSLDTNDGKRVIAWIKPLWEGFKMDTIKAELNNKKPRNSREEQINSDPIQILFERPGSVDLNLDVIDFKKSNISNKF